MDHFEPGDPIVIRFINISKVRYVHPATIVADSDDGTAVFWGDGFPFLGPPSYRLPRGSEEQAEASFRELETRSGVIRAYIRDFTPLRAR